jgi:hypothetical protein
MKTQGWGVETIAGFGILAAWFVACAGGDIPPIDNELRGALIESFGGQDGQMPGGGAAGAGGDGESGAAGAGGDGGAGDGGAASGAAGAGGGGNPGGAGSVGGGDECDAFNTILLDSCGSAGCHGANSPQGAFAVDEASVLDFVDQPSTYDTCDGLFIDSANPEDSLLYTKLDEDIPPGCGNLQMPLTGDLLDDTQKDCVLDWLGQFAN